MTLGHWRRLQAYASLRDKLPKTETSLLELFQWANKPDATTTLSEKIAAATQWEPGDIEKLIAPEHFDLNRPDAFRNEVNLLKLQKALQVAGAIGTDIDRLFAWANPVSQFSVCHHIAEGIRATLRARYDQEDWEQVVKPLNDQLREDQKQALISYLLVQPDLIDWGVVDADSLFEFFLIDVQMDACMETSRIKQAISTVQLFVQRCLLGLEDRVQSGIRSVYQSMPSTVTVGNGCRSTASGRPTARSSSTRKTGSSPSSATTKARSTRNWNRSCCKRTSIHRPLRMR